MHAVITPKKTWERKMPKRKVVIGRYKKHGQAMKLRNTLNASAMTKGVPLVSPSRPSNTVKMKRTKADLELEITLLQKQIASDKDQYNKQSAKLDCVVAQNS